MTSERHHRRPFAAAGGPGEGEPPVPNDAWRLAPDGSFAELVFDLVNVVLVTLDRFGRVVSVNRAGCEVLGRSSAEIEGRSWTDLVPGSFRANEASRLSSLLAGIVAEPLSHRSPLVNHRGDEVPMAWRSASLRDDTGRISGVLLAGEDISIRQAAEDALAESERRFRMMASVMPVIFWMVSPDWRHIRYVSPAWESIYGRSCEEVYRDPSLWLATIHPEDRARVVEFYETHHGEPTDQEYRIVRSDGLVRWVRDVSSPIRGERGELLHLAGFAEDVTERRLAQQALAESEANFRRLADNANDAIVILSASARFVYVNRRMVELSGYAIDELVGKAATELVDPAAAESVMDRFAARLEGRHVPSQYETTLIRKGGDRVPVEVTSARTEWHGQPAVMAVARDVSERVHYQESLRRSLQEKDVLLKELHHRVRNNLQIITGLLDITADGFAMHGGATLLADLARRVSSMAVIHDHLFHSSSSANVDAAAYLQAIAEHLRTAFASEHGTTALAIEVADVEITAAVAVPCGLIISELVANAFKHAFSEVRARSEARVEIGFSEAPDGRLSLTVADNGCGLPAGMDWRQSPSLGLQLVDSLAHQLRAEVSVRSDRGTVFELLIPARSRS